ncbi:MAG TPA: histidine kinase [Spirochaeta sp.]|nr:histidine kinase [Spirochaeta sp.]
MDEIPLILIVDDDETNLVLLRSILEKEGFRILEANDGGMARGIASAKTPDLILLDIMMPGEDGFEVCSKLKTNPQTADIPVIFISAISETDKKVHGFDIGAVDYITKPFGRAEVVARTKLHLRLSSARKSLIENQRNKLKQLTQAQQEILIKPEELPLAGFSVFYNPIQEAGGDFYDVIQFGKDIYGYFCADVSGHGLGASLATSAFKALIHQNAGVLFSPNETMQTVNSVLWEILGGDTYLTAVYVLLNKRKKSLKIASAGHPPVIYSPVGEPPYPVRTDGDVLGMFPNIIIEKIELKVNDGDRFYLYTDGIIEESMNEKISRAEGINKLLAKIKKTEDIKMAESITGIMGELFPSIGKAGDDILLMGVEV